MMIKILKEFFWRNEVSPFFWVAGLLIFAIEITVRISPFGGETLEWICFLVVGLVFPLVIIFISCCMKKFYSVWWWRFLTYFLGFGFIITACFVLWDRASHIFILAGIIQVILFAFLTRSNDFSKAIFSKLFLAWVAWLACSKFCWWSSSPIFFQTEGGILLFFFALVLACWILFEKKSLTTKENQKTIFELLFDSLALLFFFYASTKIGFDFHDTSFVAGTIELVKQGGWLLWDVPSQYGFLNVLIPAVLPVRNSWYSLYLVCSLLSFISALIVYLFLNSLGSGVVHRFASFLLTVASVFMLPGWAPELAGANYVPVVSSFRFFWVFIILWISALLARTDLLKKEERRNFRKIILIGAFAWLFGTLWSSESAIYCCLIWLTTLTISIYRYLQFTKIPSVTCFNKIFCILIFHFFILFLVFFGISFIYFFSIGFFPDWSSFFEYALAYGKGFGSLPIDPNGSVWWLVIAFSCTVSALFIELDSGKKFLPIIAPSLVALWITHSYYIARSHDNNILNLSPIMLLVLVLVLRSLQKISRNQSRYLASIMVPFFTMILASTFGNFDCVPKYFESIFEKNSQKKLIEKMPKVPDEVQELFNYSGVKNFDRLTLVSNVIFPYQSDSVGYLNWLPLAPASQLSILPMDRQDIYIKRFIDRRKECGWLLQPITFSHVSDGVLIMSSGEKIRNFSASNEFKSRCEFKKRFQSQNFLLDWYLYRAPPE